ncbi:MAG: hypothetical protein ACRC50_01875 [Gaiella sp.]
MSSTESVRVEVAFEGGQIIGMDVTSETADAIERAVSAGSGGTVQVDTEDGRVTIVVPLVVYVKRFARDGRVGFGLEHR